MKIIVIGAGGLGYHIAEKLARENNDVVVIEQDDSRVRYLLEHLDVQVQTGSGSSPDVLERAGVEDADILVAVTDSDEVNMVACLIAAAQTRTPRKIARIRNDELLKHPRLFGHDFLNVDYSINPEAEVVREIERMIEIPGCTDLAEFSHGKVMVAGFRIKESSPMVGPTLSELWRNGTSKQKLLLAAIQRGRKVIVPDGKQKVKPGDIVFVVHPSETISEVYPILGVRPQPVKFAVISGASRIGVNLARALQRRNITVKLIDPNRERCVRLSEQLEATLVLNADPHDEEMLREEHVGRADVFIAAGEEDDTNVLVSLLAGSMGARRVITLVNQVRYIPLIQAVGNHVALCPKLIAVSQIVQFIRRGKVISVATFGDDEAEAMEIIALAGSKIVETPLKKLKLPRGVIVGALVRAGDQLTIPDGDAVIHPGDRVVFFVQRNALSQFETLLEGR